MTETRGGYENYTVTSQNYDLTRVPIGVDFILGAFAYSSKRPLKDLHVLDAGCGTGNYTVALSEYVGKVTGLEFNEGMLSRAMEKTASLKNVTLMQGDITSMPFSDSHFDGLCCNQVIHHLDAPGTTEFPKTKAFLSESFRVLKPGGSLLINIHTPEQSTSKCMWYYSLLPEAAKRQASRLPTVSTLHDFLKGAGFNLGSTVNVTETIFREDHWLDKEGPFRQEWRNTDSIFSLATPSELEEALKWWRGKIEDGSADDYLRECEAERLRLGLAVTVAAYKPEKE